MTRQEYLEQWLKWHEGYEQRSRKYFRDAIISFIGGFPIDNISYSNYQILLDINKNLSYFEQAYYRVYKDIGLLHGNRVGRGINAELKEYSRPFFNQFFSDNILDWVRRNCGDRIVSVANTVVKRISLMIEKALEDGLTNEQMRVLLQKNLEKNILTKYELNRIVRTETTTAANHGAMMAGETSGVVLDKVWIATKDNRTRRIPRDQFDHINMDNVKVGQYEDFILRSRDGIVDKLQYPGATGGSASDVIQCRCTFALVARRDADGFVIRR